MVVGVVHKDDGEPPVNRTGRGRLFPLAGKDQGREEATQQSRPKETPGQAFPEFKTKFHILKLHRPGIF
jgi:hypothetical protein